MCTTSVFIVPSVAFARVTRMPGGEDCGHRPFGGFVSGDVQCISYLPRPMHKDDVMVTVRSMGEMCGRGALGARITVPVARVPVDPGMLSDEGIG
jgi:hypothetical protein